MDRKVWLGFLAGIALAGGASYFWTHRTADRVALPTLQVQTTAQLPAPPRISETTPIPEIPKPVVKPAPAKAVKAHGATVAQMAPPVPPVPATLPQQPPPPQVPAQAPLSSERPAEPSRTSLSPPRPPAPSIPPPPPEAPQPHSVTIPKGALLNVRVLEMLSSERNRAGDTFMITLDQPLVVDGFVLAERGAHGEGRVVEAKEAGRVRGVALLSLELTRLSTSDGQNVTLRTERVEREGPESKNSDAAKVGAGAVLGTIIGAVAGGGKGAAIGAAAGGAAGAGTVMATRGKPAVVLSESRISFRLEEPLSLTERLGR